MFTEILHTDGQTDTSSRCMLVLCTKYKNALKHAFVYLCLTHTRLLKFSPSEIAHIFVFMSPLSSGNHVSSSSDTELRLMFESYGLVNDIFPSPSILDAGHPIFNLHLAYMFDVILPSLLWSSLWSIGWRIPFKYLECSGIWHSLCDHTSLSLSFNIINYLMFNGPCIIFIVE